MFDTKFLKIGADFQILDKFEFFIFIIVTSNFKNSMYPRSFLCEHGGLEAPTGLTKMSRQTDSGDSFLGIYR